jgi:16S rRNA G966 N2-methylase RsmD
MGIEALSRGAASAMFVDAAPAAVRVIRENLRRTRLEPRAAIRRLPARAAIRRGPGQFDLVLLDPPYRLPAAELDALLQEIAGQGVVATGGIVVLTRQEQGYIPVIPLHWRLERRLSYGEAAMLVFRTP